MEVGSLVDFPCFLFHCVWLLKFQHNGDMNATLGVVSRLVLSLSNRPIPLQAMWWCWYVQEGYAVILRYD